MADNFKNILKNLEESKAKLVNTQKEKEFTLKEKVELKVGRIKKAEEVGSIKVGKSKSKIIVNELETSDESLELPYLKTKDESDDNGKIEGNIIVLVRFK